MISSLIFPSKELPELDCDAQAGGRNFVNFPGMNYQRYFGKEWSGIVSQGIHDRMRAWGLNTLGCWSDDKLQKERKLLIA